MIKPNVLTESEFAAALDWRPRNVAARLVALGHTQECSRCQGTGHFSYNRTTGTTCFKCNGAKRTLKPLTARLLETVKSEVAAGKLNDYLARCQAAAAARAELAPLFARAEAAIKFQCDRYEQWYRNSAVDDLGPEGMMATQTLCMALFFGGARHMDVTYREVGLSGRGLREIIEKAGREIDAFQARDEVLWRVEMLEMLDREVRAMCQAA